MKIILLFILILTNCLTGFTQSEFAPIGAEWYYSAPGVSGTPLYSYEKYVSRGDTVIEGKRCKIIKSQNFSEVMYEENNKVYYRYRNDFKLIYDFAVNLCDTVGFNFKSFSPNSSKVDTTYIVNCVVEQIDTVEIKGQKLRRIYTYILQDEHLTQIVWPSKYIYMEKIGYEYDFMFILPIPSIGSMHNLRCYNDDNINYTSEWWKYQNKACDFSLFASTNRFSENYSFSISPNPATNYLNINISNYNCMNSYCIKIYDYTGNIVLEKIFTSSQSQLDISRFTNGLYYISIYNNSVSQQYKVIKL